MIPVGPPLSLHWCKRVYFFACFSLHIAVLGKMNPYWLAVVTLHFIGAMVRWLWLHLADGQPGRKHRWVVEHINDLACCNRPTRHEVQLMKEIDTCLSYGQLGSSLLICLFGCLYNALGSGFNDRGSFFLSISTGTTS